MRVIKGLYQDSRTTVQCGAGFTESFPVIIGLHQGSVLSPFLFALVVDTVSEGAKRPLLNDLLYADDLAIVTESEEELQERLIQWQENLENKGLRVNSKKTEVMVSSKLGRKVKIMDRNDIELKQVDEFCYLGTVIEEKGGCSKSARARIGKAWQKWREVARVVCDKRTPLKTKAKIYKSVIRPALLYGTESATLRREEERRLEVTEMRMLRNMCRRKKEHRRNDEIRKLAGVVNIIEKAKEGLLRWLGHVRRREPENGVRRAYETPVKGKRSRGRQKLRWRDVIARDMKQNRIEHGAWKDRNNWRKVCRAADPV